MISSSDCHGRTMTFARRPDAGSITAFGWYFAASDVPRLNFGDGRPRS